MLAGFQELEAAGCEQRGGSNKGPRDRHIVGRLGILPGPRKDWPETFRESNLLFPCPWEVWAFPPSIGTSVPAHCAPEREASAGRNGLRLRVADDYSTQASWSIENFSTWQVSFLTKAFRSCTTSHMCRGCRHWCIKYIHKPLAQASLYCFLNISVESKLGFSALP